MEQEKGYVSKYLTHFVGRSICNDEDRFELLCEILHESVLKPRKLLSGRGDIQIDLTQALSSNELFTPEAVCFCDIPLNREQLRRHIKQYSAFGIAFEKHWLAKHGANPVFYMAEGSMLTDHKFIGEHPRKKKLRKDFFDEVIGLWFTDHMNPRLRAVNGDVSKLTRMENLILWYFLAYCKFFDETLEQHDRKNWYMEREWRTIGSVRFKLTDIAHVILPETYVCEFKRMFPELKDRVFDP